jgi:hypothetical protein
VERGQQETDLILEIVQVRNGAVREVGRLEDETLRDVTAATEMLNTMRS